MKQDRIRREQTLLDLREEERDDINRTRVDRAANPPLESRSARGAAPTTSALMNSGPVSVRDTLNKRPDTLDLRCAAAGSRVAASGCGACWPTCLRQPLFRAGAELGHCPAGVPCRSACIYAK